MQCIQQSLEFDATITSPKKRNYTFQWRPHIFSFITTTCDFFIIIIYIFLVEKNSCMNSNILKVLRKSEDLDSPFPKIRTSSSYHFTNHSSALRFYIGESENDELHWEPPPILLRVFRGYPFLLSATTLFTSSLITLFIS